MPAPEDFFSLADGKSFLGIDDTDSDALLQVMLGAATQAVVDYLCWDPNLHEATERYSGLGVCSMVVNRRDITAVSAITTEGYSGVPVQVDLTKIYWSESIVYSRHLAFPRGRRNIVITYTAGLDPMPASIILAAKMTLKAMWSGKDFEQNATGSSVPGIESLSFFPNGPGAIPPQAISYLTRYRLELLAS